MYGELPNGDCTRCKDPCDVLSECNESSNKGFLLFVFNTTMNLWQIYFNEFNKINPFKHI